MGTERVWAAGSLPYKTVRDDDCARRALTAVCVTFAVRNDVQHASNIVYDTQHVHSFAGSVRLAAWRCVPLVYIV